MDKAKKRRAARKNKTRILPTRQATPKNYPRHTTTQSSNGVMYSDRVIRHSHGHKENLVKSILKLACELGREGHGTLFVIGNEKKLKGTYECLYPNLFDGKGIHIETAGMEKIIPKLAELDGAFIIDYDGRMLAHGAKIKKTVNYPGYGTRHAAALGITFEDPDITSILVSDHKWVRVFKDKQITMEIDPFSELKPNLMDEIINFITRPDVAALTSSGLGTLALGLSPITVLVLGGTYYITKKSLKSIEKVYKIKTASKKREQRYSRLLL